MIYKKLKILFNKNQLLKLYGILLGSILAAFFEVVGIGSIPVFAMLIIDIESLLTKVSTYISIDFLLGFEESTLIIFGASLLALIFIIKNLYLFLLLFFQGKLIKELRSSTSNKLYKYYINSPYLKHLNQNPAILIRTMQSDIGNTFTFILSYIMLIRENLILFSIFLLLIFADPLISIFSFLSLVVPVLLFYYLYKNTLKARGKILQEQLGKKIKNINQSLGAIKETKILNRENLFLNIFLKLNDKVEKMIFFSYLISSSPRLFLEVMALFTVAVISSILIFIGRSPETILPLISLLSVSAVRFIPALNVITSSLTTIRFQKPSFDLVVDEIEKLNLTEYSDVQNKQFYNNKNEDFSLRNNILIKDISFSYESGKRTEINDITINIKKGTSVGLIGRSGSGKSTLVDIILGLLEPNKGGIYVDDKNINILKSYWHKQIGYIPQDIYLLDDTIRNNITFGLQEDKINEKFLSEAIKVSQLENFVKLLPDKLNTIVGNRGVRISGGEKQRIGIARALYNKPKVMILDEATSSLDLDNENKILEEINENKDDKTLIIISHRNNTVKYCDLIYVIEQGNIIDYGSYKKIMEKHKYLKENKIIH